MSTDSPFGSQPETGAGAFAVPDNVDWETVAFADEATPSPAAAPPAAPPAAPAAAPAPAVAPAAPALPQAPAATPAPAAMPTMPPAQPTPPAPAQPVAPATPPAAPAPAAYQPPAAPAQPAAPVYQQPAAPAAPAPASYQPPAQPAAAAPVPAQASYTPAHNIELEDLAEPEWARIGPVPVSETEMTFAGIDDDIAVGDPVQAIPTPATPAKGRKGGRAPKPAGKTRNPAREQKKNEYAGGRWMTKVIRVSVFAIAALLMAGGFKNILVAEDPTTTAELAKAVQAEMGNTGFPTEAAETFAIRYAREYLTYDAAGDSDAREQRLAAYAPAAATMESGWDGTGQQSIITGPYVAVPTEVDGKNYATITVTAQVSTGQWVALAVPVYASGTGALAVAGAPAFVTQPTLASSPGRPREVEEDSETADAIEADVLPGFLMAWAASNQTELDRYITPDATAAAKTGLGGTVTYDSIAEVKIFTGGDTREGTVSVLWRTVNAEKPNKAAGYRQTYNLTVSKSTDGRWYVKDISGGSFAENAQSATADTNTPAS